MDQLANHMVTGEHGSNLLVNADAVADLLNEKKSARAVPSKEYRNAVDRLTTLYAIEKLDPGIREALSSLVQTEGKGMNFVLSYLSGLRKAEVAKTDGMAKYNAVKGFVPSEQLDGADLRIAHDSETADLLSKSYVKVGDYKGSRLDAGRTGLSYWASPVSMRAKFNQGLIQNVVHTAGGVDRATGFTDRGITAGRITNPGEVATIAKRLSQEGNTSENLKPIYNENGRLVAFERTADPERVRALNRSTDLTKMMGVTLSSEAQRVRRRC